MREFPSSISLARYVAELVMSGFRQLPPGVFVIAISGPDCVGKTSLAGQVAGALKVCHEMVRQLAIDDYLIPRSQRDGLPDEATSYYEKGFDYPRLRASIEKIVGDSSSSDPMARAVVVVEGVFLLRSGLMDLWDMSVWLDADEATIVSRRVERDATYFGGQSEARRVYLTRLLPAQALHRQADSPEDRASLVFRFDGAVWRSVREPQLGDTQQKKTDRHRQGEHAKRENGEP